MADSDDGFASRWSRRKRAARAARSKAGTPAAVPAAEVPVSAESSHEAAPVPPEALPDPETLSEESDFAVFLKDGVPEAIRRKALRRLWRLNPVFANLDGLNDYDEDFHDVAAAFEGLKSLYKAGRGYETDEDEPDQETAAEEGARQAVGADDEVPPAPQDIAPAGAIGPAPGPVSGARAAEGSTRVGDPARRRRGARARRWGDSSA